MSVARTSGSRRANDVVMHHLIGILLALAACPGASTAPAPERDEPAGERRVLFYTLRASDADVAALDRIAAVLTDFHAEFLALSSMSPEEFSTCQITVDLHAPGSEGGRLGFASMTSTTVGAGDPAGPGVGVVGTVDIPGPAAHDGSSRSTSGHPMDRDYFDKLLIHEIAPVYLEVYARNRGGRFHDASPDWFEQGLEEYMGVWHSTAYWRETGFSFYVDRWRERPGLDADFGVNAVDEYNDGLLLTTFIAQEFGEHALLDVLTSPAPTFGKRLHEAVGVEHPEFVRRCSAWLQRSDDRAAPDPHDP